MFIGRAMNKINNAIPELWKQAVSKSGLANGRIKLRYVLIFLWVLFVGSVVYIAVHHITFLVRIHL